MNPKITYINHEGTKFDVTFEHTGVNVTIIRNGREIGESLTESFAGSARVHIFDPKRDIDQPIHSETICRFE